jgi:hypothetical protein
VTADTAPRRRSTLVNPLAFAIGTSLVISGVIGLGLQVVIGGAQVFALSATARLIALPVTYGLAAVALLLGRSRNRFMLPGWGVLLVAVTTCSAIAAAFLPRQDVRDVPMLEGCLFLFGFALLVALGHAFGPQLGRAPRGFLVVVAACGIAQAITSVPFASAISLSAVAGAVLLYGAIRADLPPLLRLAAAVGAALAIVPPLVVAIVSPDQSSATIGAVGVSLVVVLLAVLPVWTRPPAAVVGLLVAIVALARSSLVTLMAGDWRITEDVTLSHRAFEAHQVYALLSASPITTLLGAGPGAWVDLTQSPDRATLASSGRDLLHTDDVHFLIAWILLKLGVLGLLVFAAAIILTAARIAMLLLQPRPRVFEIFLATAALSGLAVALPAGSYLMSNPLTPIAFGALSAIRLRTKPLGVGSIHQLENLADTVN